MEKLEHRPDNSFVNVRITLVVIAIVSFPFNIIGIFTANAQTASINQLVAVSIAISISFLHDSIVTQDLSFFSLAALACHLFYCSIGTGKTQHRQKLPLV